MDNVQKKQVPTLKLSYKPDAGEAQERMRAFWEKEIINRPCVCIKAPKDGITPPRLPQILAPDFDFVSGVAKFEEWASCMFFGGEAFPYLWVGWGPDQLAAFLGAELVLAPETDTSWAQPSINDWMNLDHLTIDNNKWWLGVLEFCRTAAKMGEGKFLVSHLDLHSNLDCISALRGAANLCLDLIENPDKVLQAVNWVNELYKPVYDAVFDAGNMDKYGSITWLELWCDSKTHVPSCDFCSFISPEHFRRFVLPSIEYEVSCLDTAVYHLDGPGQLPHLDDILSIPKLHGIQWVPGAGAAPMPDWLDILKKIQSAGKIVHIGVTPEELKVLHGELEPNKVFYQVWGCSSETDARELIAWLENHT